MDRLDYMRYDADYRAWMAVGLSPIAAHGLAVLALNVRRTNV